MGYYIDIMALALSCVAILMSILELVKNDEINKVNLQSVYYQQIFEDYLLNDIPRKITYIDFGDEGKLNEDYRQLTITLMEMLEKCLYFKFANKKFYDRLKDLISELDDELIIISGKQYENKYDREKALAVIYNKISGIVKCVNKYYMNHS